LKPVVGCHIHVGTTCSLIISEHPTNVSVRVFMHDMYSVSESDMVSLCNDLTFEFRLLNIK